MSWKGSYLASGFREGHPWEGHDKGNLEKELDLTTQSRNCIFTLLGHLGIFQASLKYASEAPPVAQWVKGFGIAPTARIQSLAQELPYAKGVALKKKKSSGCALMFISFFLFSSYSLFLPPASPLTATCWFSASDSIPVCYAYSLFWFCFFNSMYKRTCTIFLFLWLVRFVAK